MSPHVRTMVRTCGKNQGPITRIVSSCHDSGPPPRVRTMVRPCGENPGSGHIYCDQTCVDSGPSKDPGFTTCSNHGSNMWRKPGSDHPYCGQIDSGPTTCSNPGSATSSDILDGIKLVSGDKLSSHFDLDIRRAARSHLNCTYSPHV